MKISKKACLIAEKSWLFEIRVNRLLNVTIIWNISDQVKYLGPNLNMNLQILTRFSKI